VIGGHSGVTILPLLSQSKPPLPQSVLSDKTKIAELVKRIQFGGDEVVAAKDGAGSATLSMAAAGFRFAESLIQAILGQSGVVEMGYIYVADDKHISAHTDGLEYFSVPIELGVSRKQNNKKIWPQGSSKKARCKTCAEGIDHQCAFPTFSPKVLVNYFRSGTLMNMKKRC
jgi:malate dehydrogenase